uniref:Amine oxidase domain-containing protein n=1 Tax=Fibrocapsa japonica TaxID=94617 RepID=A0A7S2XUH5_9STRA
MYLVPMAAAVWSAAGKGVLDFPARYLIQFFHNHCFLQLFNRPQWLTVKGRSKTYVDAISKELGKKINKGVAAVSVTRQGGMFTIKDSASFAQDFDQVIFACHADEALALLGEHATDEEQSHLAAIGYKSNHVYVHSDPTLMPVRKNAWASWNYLCTDKDPTAVVSDDKPVFVTYYLNQLQNLDVERPILVSLNPTIRPKAELTHHEVDYAHPQFTEDSAAAVAGLKSLQGKDGAWYAGAYMGYGFHEDGLRSGLEVATAITKKPVPWMDNGSHDLVCKVPDRSLDSQLGPLEYIKAAMANLLGKFFCWQLKGFLGKSLKSGGGLGFLLPNGAFIHAGGQPGDTPALTVRVFDWWFFVRVALEYDLGLARSYLAGEWEIDGENWNHDGLTRLFLLFVENRDAPSNSLNISNLISSWVGYGINFLRYRLSMDNSLSGSRSNIEAHYDLSNELFKTFLDEPYMMYSSAIYDAKPSPSGKDLVLSGTLEEAEARKLDVLLAKAQVQPHHRLLDVGFGWGGLTIRAAETIGCRVHGITLSKEQKALAEERVKARGLGHLITYELVDYRVFADLHPGEFDRIISCEMIEAVGHNYLGQFYRAMESLLKPDGILVMEAITTPESRYVEYLRSTDFINTIIFPGSCCPSLTALLDAASKNSSLTLEGVDNICLHYAETLREWRRRFNKNLTAVRAQGFDSIFIRCWNYYLCYCEAGFQSQTEGCLILVFSRPGNRNLLPYSSTNFITRSGHDNSGLAAPNC